MKLIVAGLPKTGTNSLAKGLQMLGYRVYDTKDNYTHFYEQWMRIMDRGGLPVDFRDMYHDIDASLDVPVVYYWEEILKAFPGTKIILMVRDNEEVWCKSMVHQLRSLSQCGLFSLSTVFSPSCRKFQDFLNRALRLVFGIEPIRRGCAYEANEQALKITYRNHNARVMQIAQDHQLLVFNCNEGWGPLCSFLGVHQPQDVLFPHENKNAEIVNENNMKKDPGYLHIRKEIFTNAFGVFLCAFLIFIFIFFVAYFIRN